MGNAKPPVDVLSKRNALMIACSHYLTHGSWPYLPNIIEVGGLQLKDPSPLPQELQDFMDSSKTGVVLISFGSQLKPDQMPPEKLAIFLDTFRRLEISILWKWGDHVTHLPGNVKISSWLPQQDLLGHPNLKAFVTHGGLGSLVEAIYHKTVVIGIPFSNDQKPNLKRASRHGYSVTLDWENLNVETFVNAINNAMYNETMKASMQRIHSLYIDRDEKPVKKAAWWVEYVCRHSGADHLKFSFEDIPWYQYHHVDIISFLMVCIAFVISLVVYIIKKIFECFSRRKSKTE